MNELLAIIPARANSKRLPDKNLKLLYGKPLIAYSIEAAKLSKNISKIIVSTDSKKISSIALEYGAEVPFIRPEYLATDKATSIDVIKHAINEIEKSGKTFDNIILLQPTSPLRTSNDIDIATDLFFNKKADSVISIVEVSHRPEWYIRKNNQDKITYLLPKKIKKEEVNYLINGSIYIFKKKLILDKNTLLGEKTYGYVMPPERSVDIDTSFDFKIAQFMLDNSLDTTNKIF